MHTKLLIPDVLIGLLLVTVIVLTINWLWLHTPAVVGLLRLLLLVSSRYCLATYYQIPVHIDNPLGMPLIILRILVSLEAHALAWRFPAAGRAGFQFEVGISTYLASSAWLRREATTTYWYDGVSMCRQRVLLGDYQLVVASSLQLTRVGQVRWRWGDDVGVLHY